MSDGLRAMLGNRRFAIPLIILLGFCFIGLLMIGFVLIFKPGATPPSDTAAKVAVTAATDTPEPPTSTTEPSATASPTATRTPTGTPTQSAADEPPLTSVAAATAEPSDTPQPTTEPTSEGGSGEATATSTPEDPDDDELAQTGLGWGLVLVSSVGLGALAVLARRLRMAGS
jgi:hypothetical protein